jgi:hypothetical protein
MMADSPRPPRAAPGWGKARVLAVGHSTRPVEELVALLRSCGVATLADVRTDALFARGVVVEHIVGRGRTRPHRLTPFAVLRGRQVTYPAAPAAGAP